jgi:probable rRNA maturation factor
LNNILVYVGEGFNLDVDLQFVRRVAEKVFYELGVEGAEVSLTIGGDELMRELNLKYRSVPDTTDVLSFPFCEGENFISPPDGVIYLGEVIISYPQAKKQAQEYRHSFQRELSLLIVHGVLHLLGYDHGHEMSALEERIVSDTI